MKRKPPPAPGPDAQWSADGQWWWDGDLWTQMWEPPRGLAWDGQTWVRVFEAPVVALHPTEPELERQVEMPPPNPGPPRNRPPRVRRYSETGGQTRPPRNQPPPAPRFTPEAPRLGPRSQDAVPAALTASPRRELQAPPPAQVVYTQAASHERRIPNRTTWLVAVAMILVVAGIFSVALAIWLGRPSGVQGTLPPAGIGTVRLTPVQITKALVGRQFTRDVVPPELADAAPLHDVFVADAIPGLIGQSSTTTSDFGGTVTFYVFADPVWAEAFYENPPTAYGCNVNVCSSMGDPTPFQGVGDKATSYVLYRKKQGGQGWIATTTYSVSGSVVINGLYFPVNVASASPSPTDLAIATAYARAAVQLLKKISN